MKTKTIELFEFDELPEKIKEKVLDNLRYVNVEDSSWYDYDGKTGFNSEELKRMKLSASSPDATELLTWKELYFNLSYGYRYIQFTEAQFANSEVARRFLSVNKKLWDKVYWSFVNFRETTTYLAYESQDGEDFTSKEKEVLDRAVSIFSDKMKEALRDLESSYEYLTKDEAIIDTIKANEWTFRANGKMENM